jgi:hypothetical protein
MLVDGRNRRAACKLAGYRPEIRLLYGEDPTAYVLSANVHRRHMTAGQRAIAVAVIYPESEKGGRGQKGLSSKGFSDVASGRLSQARTVLKLAPDLVDGVLAGSVTLDAAYKAASDRKKARDWHSLDVERLRRRAPDLAQRAEDGELSIAVRCPQIPPRRSPTSGSRAPQTSVATAWPGSVAPSCSCRCGRRRR